MLKINPHNIIEFKAQLGSKKEALSMVYIMPHAGDANFQVTVPILLN